MTVKIKLDTVNGSLVRNKTYAPTHFGTQTIKLTGSNGSFISYPTSVPSVTTSALIDLSNYSNTATVLNFDAVSYANAIAYVGNNYVNSASLNFNSLNDVNEPENVTNNSTFVYDTVTNKYIVKQLNLDGGNF